MMTEYDGRLAESDEVDVWVLDPAFEVVGIDFVLSEDLAFLCSATGSSSPPDEANESCGLKNLPWSGAALLRRVDGAAFTVVVFALS
jgi:hypothetical protein